jgi:hypothetical protein
MDQFRLSNTMNYFKIRFIHIIVCSLVLISLSCSKKPGNNQGFTFQPRIDNLLKDFKFSDIVEEYKYIKLETNKNCLIGNVNQLLIYKGKIFILTEEIYCFDMEGKFLFSINKKGRGPSEFNKIYNFSIDEDKVYINDLRKILSFDCNTGEFLKSYKLEYLARKIGVAGNNLYNDLLPATPQTKNGRIFMSNIENPKSITALFNEKKFEQSVHKQYTGYDKNFYFIDPYLNQVYKISDGKIVKYLFFDFGDKNPTEAENATRLANNKMYYVGFNKAYQLENVYETPDFVMANIILMPDGLSILFDKNSNKSIAWNTSKDYVVEPFQYALNDADAVYGDYFCKVLYADVFNKNRINNNPILGPGNPEYNNYIKIKETDVLDNPIIAMFKFKRLR